MSAPKPPESIYEALAPYMRAHRHYTEEAAQAVWDALLAEGRLDHERDSWASTHPVLVIPLGDAS